MFRPCLLICLSMLACAWDDANFLDWFEDELREQVNAPLVFEGKVPSYITGVFVQTGPARFHFGEMKFTHMLDGYSKTNTVRFLKDGTANFTTEFLASEFLNESIQGKGISRGMFVGSVEPSPLWGPTAVAAPNDNNYIKMRKVGDQHLLLSDTMIVTEVQGDCVSFQSNLRSKLLEVFNRGLDWQDSLEPLGDLCMLGTMAHADEDPVTGIFTGAMGCFGLSGNYHMVFTIDPSSITTRKLLASLIYRCGENPSSTWQRALIHAHAGCDSEFHCAYRRSALPERYGHDGRCALGQGRLADKRRPHPLPGRGSEDGCCAHIREPGLHPRTHLELVGGGRRHLDRPHLVRCEQQNHLGLDEPVVPRVH
mmetsp:Transcript_2109/g.8232  ORF Transcript_2109/g.8232 Transcript_2109/m.8232 type:complete len:367 (+) Transcript_2109:54-1154(+)